MMLMTGLLIAGVASSLLSHSSTAPESAANEEPAANSTRSLRQRRTSAAPPLRCNMLDGSIAHGAWVEARPTVSGMLPISCPLGAPFTVDAGKRDSELDARVCAHYEGCFSRDKSKLSSAEFRNKLDSLLWRWAPTYGDCSFSPIGEQPNMGGAALASWANKIERSSGPWLWVGDRRLELIYAAWQALTAGPTSTFHYAGVLVNSWTLAPMTDAEISACEAGSALEDTPCPPTTSSVQAILGGAKVDNSHHILETQKWTQLLTALQPATLVRALR